MRYPKHLPPGGTIGFVAPSMGCDADPYKTGFEKAQENFKALGYSCVLGPNCYAGEGVGISNTPKKCAAELMEGYFSKESDCLISCGGGELMCEVMSYMDFEALAKAEPKWFMGYSDNTNMTYLLATLCDTASIYGPCAPAFGMEPWHPAISDALKVLTGEIDTVHGYELWEKESLKDEEHPLAPYNVTEKRVIRCFYGQKDNAVHFTGRLLGGCLDCLVNLLGTRFDRTAEFVERYKKDGILWFLESCDLNVFGIRRALWQMEEAGWFEHVKGFLIGRPACFGQEIMGLDAYRAVLEVAGRRNVPVIMDVDLGHLPPMMPIMVGCLGDVRVQGNEIEIKMREE